jgi:hypothetical protein
VTSQALHYDEEQMPMSPLVFLVSLRSYACPGDTVRTEGKKVVANDATHCARSDGVIGAHCSYATGIMARRIMEQGQDAQLTGTLVEISEDVPGGVSAPFRLEDDPKSRVLANELIEQMVRTNHIGQAVEVDAKELDVDGIHYYVLTAYEVPNS